MAVDLIQIKGLKTYFFQGKGLLSKWFGKGLKIVHAVDGVSLTIRKGRTFGLVGESGCGKSTLGQTIFRLVEPVEGEVFFNGRDVVKMNQAELRKFRQKAQLIFQDQFGCLKSQQEIAQDVAALLRAVNLDPDAAVKFPNEFSGGQARRIGVARAIALNPEFIMADEPTSGLDISTAATILNLMQELQEKMDITYLWVSHNLNQVRYMSDDMAVMYLGKVVEMGPTSEVFDQMAHPYTKALISAVPQVFLGKKKQAIFLKGEIPSPINPPSGCRFRTRCPHALRKCEEEEPALIDLGGGHLCACHLQSH